MVPYRSCRYQTATTAADRPRSPWSRRRPCRERRVETAGGGEVGEEVWPVTNVPPPRPRCRRPESCPRRRCDDHACSSAASPGHERVEPASVVSKPPVVGKSVGRLAVRYASRPRRPRCRSLIFARRRYRQSITGSIMATCAVTPPNPTSRAPAKRGTRRSARRRSGRAAALATGSRLASAPSPVSIAAPRLLNCGRTPARGWHSRRRPNRYVSLGATTTKPCVDASTPGARASAALSASERVVADSS